MTFSSRPFVGPCEHQEDGSRATGVLGSELVVSRTPPAAVLNVRLRWSLYDVCICWYVTSVLCVSDVCIERYMTSVYAGM